VREHRFHQAYSLFADQIIATGPPHALERALIHQEQLREA